MKSGVAVSNTIFNAYSPEIKAQLLEVEEEARELRQQVKDARTTYVAMAKYHVQSVEPSLGSQNVATETDHRGTLTQPRKLNA